jgi:hypothetical protein
MNRVLIVLTTILFFSCFNQEKDMTIEKKIIDACNLYNDRYSSNSGVLIVKILPETYDKSVKIVITRLYNTYSLSGVNQATTYYLKIENQSILIIDEKRVLNNELKLEYLKSDDIKVLKSNLAEIEDGIITHTSRYLLIKYSDDKRSEKELIPPISPMYKFRF